jgi:prephenate dehydrogenase
LLANTLAACTPLDTRPLVGPGFRSSARLAPSPAGVMLDILATNSDHILDGLGRFRQALDGLERVLRSGDDQALLSQLVAGAEQYEKLV